MGLKGGGCGGGYREVVGMEVNGYGVEVGGRMGGDVVID